jgi:hypothetical protein
VFSSSLISLVYAIYLAVLGCIVGIAPRVALSFALKLPNRISWKDALLGACGMVGGFLLCAETPWPENTVTYKVGETLVTSTMNRFQHPYYVAFALALCFPLIRLGLQHRATRGYLL